ncbi:MAG: transcription termination factor NusA [Oscillatoria princeps RMCB-10]|nr:transcription termination factor NusA [Oscillatoria princeps RMCB-10]
MVSLPGLRAIIDSMSRERNLPQSVVQDALREALLKGYERYRRLHCLNEPHFKEDCFHNFQVELNLEAEGFRVLATKTVVEKVANPDSEVALKGVPVHLGPAQLGDSVVVDVTPDQGEFGRLAALQTKQVLTQKLQEEQCRLIKEQFQELRGTVLPARVVRLDRKGIVMGISSGLGKPEVEAELPNHEKLQQDNYQVDAVFKVYLKKVYETPRSGPQLRVSRATTGLVAGILTGAVPEIQQEIVQIVSVARDSVPSSATVAPRSKIAVDTQQPDLDPIAACMGERGERLQAAVSELRGEKIELVRWSDDPATFIARALAPAKVKEVRILDPEECLAEAIVPADQLPLALGPEKQNVKLAARLTGWTIEVTAAVDS